MLSCEAIQGIPSERAADIVHYAECHKNLKFGWDFANAMANQTELPFPALLHGEDLVVWEAYQFIKAGKASPAVEGAIAIETLPQWKTLRGQIRALLVSEGVTCDFVAQQFSMRRDVVGAYEKLFFNVVDRKDDHIYLANIIYPEGRMVEAFDDYLHKVDVNTLLLRAGYTHGVKHVLYATGLGKHPYAGVDASSGAADLDAMFMADGCLYASMGWLHQRDHAMPITNARLSMQASKMGGESNPTAGLLSLGDIIQNELIEVSSLKAAAHAKAAALDIVPVIPNNLANAKTKS